MADKRVVKGLEQVPLVDGMDVRFIDHDGPGSYTTGGEPMTAKQVGFRQVAFVVGMVSADAANIVEGLITQKGLSTTFKLIWSVRTTGAEVAGAVNLSSTSCKLMIVGFPG